MTVELDCLASLLAEKPVVLTLVSRSMLPLLREEDQLLVQPLREQPLRPGQIVAFRQGSQIWVHRVQSGDWPAGKLLTRGDAASLIDRPVALESLLGLVVARRRPGRPWKRLDRGLYRLFGLLQAHFGQAIAPHIGWLRKAFGRSGLLPLARALHPPS